MANTPDQSMQQVCDDMAMNMGHPCDVQDPESPREDAYEMPMPAAPVMAATPVPKKK